MRQPYPKVLGCLLAAAESGPVRACSETTAAVDLTFVTVTAASPVVLGGGVK